MISCPSRVRISFLVTISRQAADTWGQFFLAGSPCFFWITASPSLTNSAWLVRGEFWSKSPFELVPRYPQVPTWCRSPKISPFPFETPPKPWFGSGSADFWLPFGLIYCSVDRILCIFYMLMFSLTWHFLFFRTKNLRKPKCEQSPKREILSLTVWTVRYILENLGSENMQSLRLSRRGLLIPGVPQSGRNFWGINWINWWNRLRSWAIFSWKLRRLWLRPPRRTLRWPHGWSLLRAARCDAGASPDG